MKQIHQLVVAAVTFVALEQVARVQAAEPLLSPRLQSLQTRVVPGSSAGDPDLTKNRPMGNAKAWNAAQSRRTVPSSGREVDLAHAPRPSVPAKDPRYDALLRENAMKQLQVAPLK